MKILQLTAENVKKLTVVEIAPDGNIVQITGKNGQGKTSVLDSIWWALAGDSVVQSQPIRKGSKTARIELKLGDNGETALVVERKFTEGGGSYLTVRNAEGFKADKPQKKITDLLGVLTFDPLNFMRSDAGKQFDTLKGLVNLDIDLAASAKADKTDYEERTKVNRDAKAKRAQAVAIPVEDGLPDTPSDEAALLDKMQAAANENARTETRRANRETTASKVASLKADAARILASIKTDVAAIEQTAARDIADLEAQRDAITRRIEDATKRSASAIVALKATRTNASEAAAKEADELQTKLDAAGELPVPTDLSELRAELDRAKAVNHKIAAREQRKVIETEAEELEAKSKALTDAMDAREAERLAAIGKAQMPVPGLSFGDGIVTYNDLPLEQASDAEQLTISTAIAAALNPKLRVIRIRDGSLLDDDAMKRLAAFADERDMQIWIERVDGSGTVGIVMEDGHIKGREPSQQEAHAAE